MSVSLTISLQTVLLLRPLYSLTAVLLLRTIWVLLRTMRRTYMNMKRAFRLLKCQVKVLALPALL